MIDLLGRIRKTEQAVYEPSTPVGGYLRKGSITAVNVADWTVDVRLGAQDYTNVDCLQSIREDMLVAGALVFVLLSSIGSSVDALVIGTLGGRPPPDPRFDNVRGHKHRIGVPLDGAPVDQDDVI